MKTAERLLWNRKHSLKSNDKIKDCNMMTEFKEGKIEVHQAEKGANVLNNKSIIPRTNKDVVLLCLFSSSLLQVLENKKKSERHHAQGVILQVTSNS